MKLKELESKSHRLKIQHPTKGDLGTWIEVLGPHSYEYRMALVSALKARGDKLDSELTDDDNFNETAEVLSKVVTDWDTEFFELEPTEENIFNVLSNKGNSWLMNFIESGMSDSQEFFGKG